MEPWTNEQFSEILVARKRIATAGDRPQAFLYELELETHRDFLEFNPRLNESMKQERKSLIRRTCECLIRRIDSRMTRDLAISLPPRQDIDRVSDIFEDAAHLLGNGRKTGAVLLDFARGALGQVVHFTHNGRLYPYRISEPDSGFIFLFAEFGFAARAYGRSFWTNRLLLDLIRMQRYFLERNAHQRPRPWLQYRQPDRPLDSEPQRRIDAEYDAIAASSPTTERLEALMRANLIHATTGAPSPTPRIAARSSEFELRNQVGGFGPRPRSVCIGAAMGGDPGNPVVSEPENIGRE